MNVVRIILEFLTKRRETRSLWKILKESHKQRLKIGYYQVGQICENIHYFYYDLKGSFINQFCLEIVEDVINEEKARKLMKGQNIYSDSETDQDDDELGKKESKKSEVVCESKSNDKEEKDLVEQESPDNCLNELNKSDVIHDIDTDKDDDELENKESEVVPKNKSNDKEDLDLIEQESPEKCLDESNKIDVICEIDVEERIHLEVFKDKEELVNDMTVQEVSESIVEECRSREELGKKNEISKRQDFVCMGLIYNELLDDAVLEELEATFNEDETLKQIKRSDRIKEKAEKRYGF